MTQEGFIRDVHPSRRAAAFKHRRRFFHLGMSMSLALALAVVGLAAGYRALVAPSIPTPFTTIDAVTAPFMPLAAGAAAPVPQLDAEKAESPGVWNADGSPADAVTAKWATDTSRALFPSP